MGKKHGPFHETIGKPFGDTLIGCDDFKRKLERIAG